MTTSYRFVIPYDRERSGVWKCGSKASGLVELLRAGFKIPKTFLLDGAEILRIHGQAKGLNEHVVSELRLLIAEFEKESGSVYGDMTKERPLVLAVRCGDKSVDARLPETLINVGASFKDDSSFKKALTIDRDLQSKKVKAFLDLPDDGPDLSSLEAEEQLLKAVEWMLLGLAHGSEDSDRSIIIQRMVYGGYDERSCAGTAYTRNPYTGRKMDYGRYLMGVSGPRLVQREASEKRDLGQMKDDIPDAYRELRQVLDRIEEHYQDIRYVEFIVEAGEVYLLQNTVRNRIAGLYRP